MPDLPTSATGRTAADVARAAAGAASDVVLPRFRELAQSPIERVVKGRGNYVTESDLAAEAAILRVLASEYPGHRVLSEETSAEVSDWDRGWLWVIDPIDGTGNFARGIPTFAVVIALCCDGDPVLGLTYHPMTGQEFLAQQGRGLRVNGAPAGVSGVTLADSLMGIGLGYDYERAKKALALLTDLWPGVQMIQNIGSAALGLAYAASGRFDIYVHHYLFPWDLAAGLVQVREGGGTVVDREGQPPTIYSEGLIAGGPRAVEEFLRFSKGRDWR